MTGRAWVVLAFVVGVGGCTSSGVAQPPKETNLVSVSGALKPWHTVTLTLDGPFAQEMGVDTNPFTELCFDVWFEHESGSPRYRVPGYFAADGNAAETSAEAGNRWRAHLSPDKPGTWSYTIRFHRTDPATGETLEAVPPFDGLTGTFDVGSPDTSSLHPRDFRRRGRLQYVGEHHRRFAGDGSWFLKVGADAPETLLAYEEFDDTYTLRDWVPVKDYDPHRDDWVEGDPTWRNGKGKGLIGALNYLSDAGGNGISFIPYNVGGDGRNVWPMVGPEKRHRLRYDVSKLDQWAIVLDHAQRRGLHLNFKLQETENDDERLHAEGGASDGKLEPVPAALDGGALGPERRLYLREMVARFGHHLALTWNLGEENSQTPEEARAMADFLREIDPYDHHVVMQTFPHEQERKYRPLLGEKSSLTGVALQNDWDRSHQRVLQWRAESEVAGKRWVVAHDEQNHWTVGVPPDRGYPGYDGTNKNGDPVGYDEHDIRQRTLWGALMAGGEGVEYYFGWELPQGDLFTEDWRSRANSWRFGRIALDFFHRHRVPFWAMHNRNDLVANPDNANGRFCLAPRKPGDSAPYVIYAESAADPITIDLSDATGQFDVHWYDPRHGGPLQTGSTPLVPAGDTASIGSPPDAMQEDWVVLLTPVR